MRWNPTRNEAAAHEADRGGGAATSPRTPPSISPSRRDGMRSRHRPDRRLFGRPPPRAHHRRTGPPRHPRPCLSRARRGCARSSAGELDALACWRGGHTAGSAMRMLATGFGYAVAVVGMLSMLSIPVGHLLLGGAIAGVVIGIAAQQSLGNVFAGLVLLMARPFAVGNHIRVRSGALWGEFYGTVTSMTPDVRLRPHARGDAEGSELVTAGGRRRPMGPFGSLPLRPA